MEAMQAGHYQQGLDSRGDARDRRDEYQPQSHPVGQPSHPTYAQPPSATSPPPTASPFAFAPPPLSGSTNPPSRPAMPIHHSEPTPAHYQPYYSKPPQPPHYNSYPAYNGSAPMGHRSYSNEVSRQSPQLGHPPRPGPGSITLPAAPAPPALQQHQQQQQQSQQQQAAQPQAGPSPSNSPYSHSRAQSTSAYPGAMPPPSPQRSPMYPPPSEYYPGPYGQPVPGPSPGSAAPGGADMPRSLSYPSAHSHQHPHPHPYAHPHAHPYQPYHPYVPSMSAPNLVAHQGMPPLNRHGSSNLANGMASMDLSRGPSLGYSFANRLPLVDRPFKCDECVQSFNRNHDLKRHKRIHLSVKPFGCDKCGKTFSRKDALRRHWLVKGCRGDEGATAPITPMFPINSQPTTLSSPSPPEAPPHMLPNTGLSFNHPAAPPPLTTLPMRQPSSQSQILVTPNDTSHHRDHVAIAPPLEEPLAVDPALSGAPLSARGSEGSAGSGYFEGVVGLKSDGTAVLEHGSDPSSPYNRFVPSPQGFVSAHDQRRGSTMASPVHQIPSPTVSVQYSSARPYTPSNLGPDGKPVYAMPFTPTQQPYTMQQQSGMLAPPGSGGGVDMEKQASQASIDGEESWQQPTAARWHRPSFPFPPPAQGNIYGQQMATNGPMDPEGQLAPPVTFSH